MPSPDASTLISTAIVPAVIFIVWSALQAGVSRTFAPIIALVLGIAAGVGLYATGRVSDLLIAVIVGAGIGSSAVGVESGTTHVADVVKAKLGRPTAVPPTP